MDFGFASGFGYEKRHETIKAVRVVMVQKLWDINKSVFKQGDLGPPSTCLPSICGRGCGEQWGWRWEDNYVALRLLIVAAGAE